MERLRRLIFPLALTVALAVAVGVVVEESAADLDNLRPIDALNLLAKMKKQIS